MPKPNVRISPDSRLSECPDLQAGISFPSPIHERLSALVDVANDAGANTCRKEVVAALVLAAAGNGQELSELVRSYRQARARDAFVRPEAGADILVFRRHKPGPKPRHPGG